MADNASKVKEDNIGLAHVSALSGLIARHEKFNLFPPIYEKKRVQ